MSEERTFKVDMLTRVEGEGRFFLRMEEGAVAEAELNIFEAPRYFEAFLRGRSLYEVPDIVARICGICPVAYQMSGVQAVEHALGLRVPLEVLALRRLLYCAEWIESHGLHIYLLHAPDFLGYPSAVEMAKDHRELVERGLRMKKIGNELMALLGGRAVHPVSVRVGGFTRAPTPRQLRDFRPKLEQGLRDAEETLVWSVSLDVPRFEQDYVFVSLVGDRYPLEGGDAIAITGRGEHPVETFFDHFEERHLPHTNALQCRLKDNASYLCGPMSRVAHNAHQLHPHAARILQDVGLRVPVKNPYLSIAARAVEVVHAYAEALDIVDGYLRPDPPYVDGGPPAGGAVGFGATEAPRGLLFHRYEIDEEGLIEEATIVPPTSQNQARIEDDLRGLATMLVSMEHEEATGLCEKLIRSYDPCISCATHFLRLEIEA